MDFLEKRITIIVKLIPGKGADVQVDAPGMPTSEVDAILHGAAQSYHDNFLFHRFMEAMNKGPLIAVPQPGIPGGFDPRNLRP